MPETDAFALKNSGLNEFLFAEVGNEVNGLPLTILSVLARLGKDPWAEAARWARLPASSTIDEITNSISQMPLCQRALLDARTTASRLILLLPAHAQSVTKRVAPSLSKSATPGWLQAALVFALLAGLIAFAVMPQVMPAGTVPPPIAQTTDHPQPSLN